MEEIKTIIDELEESNCPKLCRITTEFPAVRITTRTDHIATATFNAMCNPFWKKRVQLKMSDNYVYFRFTDIDDKRYYTAVKVRNSHGKGFYGFRTSSVHLNRASLVGKTFKLYKYKDGYLINIREPLEV